jgi:hypothetical protein
MGDPVKPQGAQKTSANFSLQPKCFLYPAGRSILLRPGVRAGHLVTYQLGQQHLVIQSCQRRMNLLMDGSSLFPKWRYSNGTPWTPLLDNGIFDQSTEDALEYYQSLWGFNPTGKLCPTTRMLLHPSMRLQGQLWYSSSPQPKLNLFPKFDPSKFPSQPGKQPSPPVTSSDPVKADDDDDDTPWVPKLTATFSRGVSRPIWLGPTLSGAKAPRSAWLPEADRKVELDVEVPTSVAIGNGHLKLSLGIEMDEATDAAHRGSRTVSGNFQLSLDNLVKRDWGSFSPYIQSSIQQQDNQVSGVVKSGVELEFKPWAGTKWKNWSVSADGSVGYQKGVSGLDPKQDPKSLIPVEGTLNLKAEF